MISLNELKLTVLHDVTGTEDGCIRVTSLLDIRASRRRYLTSCMQHAWHGPCMMQRVNLVATIGFVHVVQMGLLIQWKLAM